MAGWLPARHAVLHDRIARQCLLHLELVRDAARDLAHKVHFVGLASGRVQGQVVPRREGLAVGAVDQCSVGGASKEVVLRPVHVGGDGDAGRPAANAQHRRAGAIALAAQLRRVELQPMRVVHARRRRAVKAVCGMGGGRRVGGGRWEGEREKSRPDQ